MPASLSRYPDGPTRAAAVSLVSALCVSHGSAAVPALTAALHDAYKRWAEVRTSPGCAKTALAGLKWTAVIFANARYAS